MHGIISSEQTPWQRQKWELSCVFTCRGYIRCKIGGIASLYIHHTTKNEDKLVTLHVHLYDQHSVHLQDHRSFDHWH